MAAAACRREDPGARACPGAPPGGPDGTCLCPSVARGACRKSGILGSEVALQSGRGFAPPLRSSLEADRGRTSRDPALGRRRPRPGRPGGAGARARARALPPKTTPGVCFPRGPQRNALPRRAALRHRPRRARRPFPPAHLPRLQDTTGGLGRGFARRFQLLPQESPAWSDLKPCGFAGGQKKKKSIDGN